MNRFQGVTKTLLNTVKTLIGLARDKPLAQRECAAPVQAAQKTLAEFMVEVEGIALADANKLVRDEFADYSSEALEELWRQDFAFDEMADDVAETLGEGTSDDKDTDVLEVDTGGDGSAECTDQGADDCDAVHEGVLAGSDGVDTTPAERLTVYVGSKVL
jgi:hypothetical protein